MHDWLLLPANECVFVRDKAKNRLFGAMRLCFKVSALRVKFNVSERQCLSGFCTEDDERCVKCSERVDGTILVSTCFENLAYSSFDWIFGIHSSYLSSGSLVFTFYFLIQVYYCN